MREPYTYVTLRAADGDKQRLTFYQFIGVEETANSDELKKAYRKKCFEWHPDRNMGDKAKESYFKALQVVYKELENKVLRAQYDRRLAIDRGSIKPRKYNVRFEFYDHGRNNSTTTTTGSWFYTSGQ